MRIAVISDIHANADAFWAVLEDIRWQGVAEILSEYTLYPDG